VIGVGAIGRQVALQSAAIGVPWLHLVDFDHVEPANLAAQGYLEEDLHLLKVHATAGLCRRINSTIEVMTSPHRFRRSMEIGNVLMCCVDSIKARKLIWDAVGTQAGFFVDGRMSAEVIRVLAIGDDTGRAYYPDTLFSAEEAYAGVCTAHTTIYTANIAAGMMVGQLTKWLRRLPVDPDMQLNLLSSELTVATGHPVAGGISP
jgi:sulfur carrier protein ThiS adenylyltransferase